MIKKISNKLIGAGLRIKYRFTNQLPSININEHMQRVKNVLIFMPEKIEHFGAALHALENLIDKKSKWKITVITRHEMKSILDSRVKVNILTFSKNDINFFGLPKPNLINKIEQSSYDLALDFLLNFDLLCFKLFEASNALVKVCLDSREKSYFYNFGIRVSAAEELTNKYNAMVKYITMFGSLSQPTENLKRADQKVR
ncbi:MAG: hypothetical protein ACE5HS_00995 [bacterium]